MLIAVTSSDGSTINQHFGKAERFMIYEVRDEEQRLVRELAAPPYCNWSASMHGMSPEQFTAAVQKMKDCAEAPPDHRMMPDKLSAIAAGLGECRVVVTVMIGEAPREELERLGIDVLTIPGPVAEVLKEVAKLY